MGTWVLLWLTVALAASCGAEGSSGPVRQRVWTEALDAAASEYPELRDEYSDQVVYPEIEAACEALRIRGLEGTLEAPGRRSASPEDRAFQDELLRRVDQDFQSVCPFTVGGWRR